MARYRKGSRRSGARTIAAGGVIVGLALSGCARADHHQAANGSHHGTSASAGRARTTLPRAVRHRWQHVVVVVEENHGAGEIYGNRDAPFINGLARTGLKLTNMHGVTHPSEPNYLAMFSGSTHGVSDDSCPHTYRTASLASQLAGRHMTFAGYSESLPSTGFTGCTSGPYARKHVPWTDFANIPARANRPLRAFPRNFAYLPTVSFVIPNLDNDMHDGSIAQGDAWLKRHLAGYATWARRHGSVLIVTWDEDDGSGRNHIATVAVGAGIRATQYASSANHYTVLASLETALGLRRLGAAAGQRAIPALS